MRRRRFFLPWVVTSIVAITAGCNYVHFGRIDKLRGDSALAAENSDLRIQKKLLQEELTIAHKERSALRTAIEKTSGSADGAAHELVEQLAATHRELEALRESYARLQAERKELAAKSERRFFAPKEPAAGTQIAGLKEQLEKTEGKLAEALHTYSTLQAENQQLRAAVEQAHAENATLTTKVQELTAANSDAQSALAQLNTVLLAQKAARAEAEQSAQALRTQLETIAHTPAPSPAATPASEPTSAPATATTPAPRLSLAAARETSADAARELTSPLKSASLSGTLIASTRSPASAEKTANAAAESPTTPAKKPGRTYVVREGDSLEKIAETVYGRRDRWIRLYSANNVLLSDGRPLKPGMTLQIPDEESAAR